MLNEMPLLTGTGGAMSVSTESTDTMVGAIPDNEFNIEDWKGLNGKKRYLLVDMIQPVKKGKKIEEELTYRNLNDCRFWGIHFLEAKEYDSNRRSPDESEKERAARWLKRFRTQMTKVFVQESRLEYFMQSNDLKRWGKLSDQRGFQSYMDLERGTKTMATELVSKKCNEFKMKQ